jgi:hypothetical protein
MYECPDADMFDKGERLSKHLTTDRNMKKGKNCSYNPRESTVI